MKYLQISRTPFICGQSLQEFVSMLIELGAGEVIYFGVQKVVVAKCF